MVICWQMGKTSYEAKTPLDEFEITISKNSQINNQTVTSIRNLTTTLTYPKIPTYNWIFSLIPNWTWFCSSLISFVAQISNLWLIPLYGPSTWLTPATWMIVIGCKVLHFINHEDQEILGYKTLWHTNAVASHNENKTLGLCIRL